MLSHVLSKVSSTLSQPVTADVSHLGNRSRPHCPVCYTITIILQDCPVLSRTAGAGNCPAISYTWCRHSTNDNISYLMLPRWICLVPSFSLHFKAQVHFFCRSRSQLCLFSAFATEYVVSPPCQGARILCCEASHLSFEFSAQ